MPSPTGDGVRVRRSIWASLSWACSQAGTASASPVTACGGVDVLLSRVAEVRRLAEVWMPERSTMVRDVAALAVARTGWVEETGDPLLPFRLLDEHGAEVPAVTEFLHHMLADDASPASLRSYAYELLAWFRSEPGQQVHAIRADRQLRPASRLQMTEIRPRRGDDRTVPVNQPVRLPPIPGRHQPAGQRHHQPRQVKTRLPLSSHDRRQ